MLRFEKVSFAYDKKAVLNDFSFTLHDGELLALMGASGSGKTTILHLAAGLLAPTAGKIESSFLPPAVVFQEPRLFSHLTVRENLAAVQEAPDESAIEKALSLVGLSEWADAYPSELSGGMQSRVSLARALLFPTDFYLLDEPFAALDEETKKAVLKNLREFLTEKGAAAILVTHAKEDAEAFASRKVFLSSVD